VPWLALFTFFNLVPALLLIAYRLNAWRDWRWQLPFAVAAAVGSLAWIGLTIGPVLSGDVGFPHAGHLRRADPRYAPLSVQGFGFLLPGEVRMYVEMTSESPDHSVIAAIGKQNAMLGGVQGSAPAAAHRRHGLPSASVGSDRQPTNGSGHTANAVARQFGKRGRGGGCGVAPKTGALECWVLRQRAL